ncbi:fimbrial protein [Aeromonas dhakensis]|nr:fimbrial protein [Aeromonas dhakensis]MBW3732952.1 fimbrial protein [Aeromonas dhakensis]QSR57595.1 fimbrial protein [Aeromonas dhakensis]RQM88032.1 fimbrial protein [Aeromonas dhakensis]TNI52496.1 fimbrial protein [Aeromonas dhakensis]
MRCPFRTTTCDEKDIKMNTSTASVRNSAIRFASSAAAAMLLGAALLPATASAYDGSVTFTGTIYEAPCDFADNSVTCYSGTQRQTMDLASLQQAGSLNTISSTMQYKLSAGSSNMAIVTVSYL